MALTLVEILRGLDSSSERMRERSMELLSESDDLRATAYLERAIAAEPNPDVQIKGERFARILKERVRSRTPAAVFERDIGSRAFTAKGLLGFFQSDPPRPAPERRAVLASVATLRARGLVPVLAQIAEACTESDLRASAVMAMAASGGDEAFAAVQTYLGDPSPEVRCAACDALCFTGVVQAYPCLVVALSDEEDGVRRRAHFHLSRLGPRNLKNLCLSLVRSSKPWRREAVARAVGVLGDPAFLPMVSPLLLDDDEGVRAAARASVESLARRGYEVAQRILDGLGPPPVPAAAGREAQPPIAPEQALEIPPLDPSMLDDPDPETRAAVVSWILREKVDDAADRLLERIDREADPPVLSCLLDGIGEVGNADSAKRLVPLLGHADARVRADAAMAVARLCEPARRQVLAPLLRDGDPRVRAAVAVALKDTPGIDLVEPLVEMTFSGDEDAQLAAANAIDAMASEAFTSLLRPLIMGGSEKVRLRAAAVLQNLIDRGCDEARQLLALMKEPTPKAAQKMDFSSFEGEAGQPQQVLRASQEVVWGDFMGSAEMRIEDLLGEAGPSKIRYKREA